MSVDLFRTRDHVADFDDKVAEYARRSADARAALAMVADVAYGPGPAETLDLFLPSGAGKDRPVHLFIHGGYWRMFSKRDFSFVAETVTKAGAIAVIVDYALMPAVRLSDIVGQVRRARRWVADNIRGYGGDPARLSVSGHSAGAHLATFLFDETQAPSGIAAALLLGGVYDIAPLRRSFLQPLILIEDEEVRRFSPLDHRFDPRVEVMILHGDRETEPFHRQASDFADHLAAQHLSVALEPLPESDHMSSVRDLGVPGTLASDLLAAIST